MLSFLDWWLIFNIIKLHNWNARAYPLRTNRLTSEEVLDMEGSKCFRMERAVSLLDKKPLCYVRAKPLGGVLWQENNQGQGGNWSYCSFNRSYFPINRNARNVDFEIRVFRVISQISKSKEIKKQTLAFLFPVEKRKKNHELPVEHVPSRRFSLRIREFFFHTLLLIKHVAVLISTLRHPRFIYLVLASRWNRSKFWLDSTSKMGCVHWNGLPPGTFLHNERQTETGHLVLLKWEMLERGKICPRQYFEPGESGEDSVSDGDLSHSQWATESWLLTDRSARVWEKIFINVVCNWVGRYNLAIISPRAHQSSDTQGNISMAVDI